MDYLNRVMQVTQNEMTYHVIKATMGEWDADNWKAYMDAQYKSDHTHAVALNTRTDRFLRLTDRRTRGYKFLTKQRDMFDTAYEKDHPKPKSPRLNGLSGMLGDW